MIERGGDENVKGMNSDEDVDAHIHNNVGVIRKDIAMEKWRLEGDGDVSVYNNDHENDDIDHDDQDNSNEDQTAEGIARQFPIASAEFASNLSEYYSHPSRSFPTLEAGQNSLRKLSQSEGFAIKKKNEKNADKHEGQCSQRTKKVFSKMILFSCVCSGKTTCEASTQSKRQTRSRLKKGCPWAAEIKKVGGRYRVKILGEHNHANDNNDNNNDIDHDDQDNDNNDHENDDIHRDGQDNSNEDQTAEGIARQFPIASTEFASNLSEYYSHPSRSFPTLEAGQNSLRKLSQSEGFAIKKKNEKNADKHEGQCSQRTKKEFSKMILFSCVCSGKTTCEASTQSKRQTRSRLKKGCPWAAEIKKVGGRYRVKILGEHNHAAIKDISIYPVARRGSPDQELFVFNLIKARFSTSTILDNLRETFNGSCLLNAKDIQNRRQKYRTKQKGLPKMDALMREMIADNVNFRVKQSEEGHITHLIIIPSSVPQLLHEERRTAVVQIDVTYRTDKCGAGMLHIVSSTNTNVTYTLGYCFMETATEKDLTWILYTFVEVGVIIDPGVIITNADQALMNSCNAVFTNAKHMLCYWHIQSNIKAQCQRDFPTREAAGVTQWTFATFLKEWSNLVLNTKTKELFVEGWKEMKEHIPTACAEYIERRWLDPYKEKFVGAYLTHIKHYGQISSSKVKGAHAAFKKTLGTTQLGVFSVYPKMKIICRAQMERISFLRARETMFLPVVKHNVFMQLYGKISTYALKLMNPEYLVAKKELSKMMNAPRSLYDPLECDGMCMSNFGLCCRHDLLELMSCGDGIHGQVNPMDIDTHWFLEKTFTPRCTTISLPVVPPVKRHKDAPRRLPIEDEAAEKEAKKKCIRCSFCKSYGHNKLSCQARIKAANENAICEYQQHQQHHLPVQLGTTSTSTAPNVNSLPLHSPRTPVTPIMPPMQMLASLLDDPIRVIAARRQCYQQDYANQDMLAPDLMTDPWIQATQYPSPSQGSATPSPSDIHGRAPDARSLQPVQAQQTRSPARDGYHYS